MSDKTMKNIPKLRFPEFIKSEEWGNTKLGEICKFVRGPFGGSLKKEIFVKDGYAVYEQTHAIYEKFDSFRYYITEEKFNELKRFSVDSSDIIMSCSGTMGKFAIIPKHSKKGVINQALLKLTVKKEFNVNFIKTTLELPENQEKLLSQSAGGAIKNVVSVNQIKDIFVFVPNLLEQKKIADCLSSVDSLITAQSQKIELLKEHKKGLLQNLFPKNGENVPKFRFPEFKNEIEWKKESLKKLFNFLRGSVFSKADIIENGMNKCIHYGELFTIYKEKISIIKSYTNITTGQFSKKDDILMPSSDVTPEGLATASAIFEDDIILGGDINILRPKKEINSLFVSYFLNSNKKEIMKLVTGTTVKHIYNKDIANLEIKIPSSILEQQKIANCLSYIDEKINLQSQKLEILKEHKKALLQQLFLSNEVING